MPGFSETFDVAIGLVFVFLVLSLFATWVQELIATALGSRSIDLVNIIQNLLDPPTNKLEGVKRLEAKWSEGVESDVARQLWQNAVKAFYEHPIIKGLAQPNELPSYISARDFAVVLFDLFTKAGTEHPTQVEVTLDSLEKGINKLQNQSTREALLAIIKTAKVTEKKTEEPIAAVRQGIEAWYNAAMERATGWYKRNAQLWALAIGIVLAVLFNADSIGVTRTLWRDSALRNTVSATAVAYIQQEDEPKAKEAQQQLEELGLPIGWSRQNWPGTLTGWIEKIIGWILTGFAVSQGSPIWFDLLNRFVNMRGTGREPEPAATRGG
jgi:hypothetical protein